MFAGPDKLAEVAVDVFVLVQVMLAGMVKLAASTLPCPILSGRLDREEVMLLLLKRIVG